MNIVFYILIALFCLFLIAILVVLPVVIYLKVFGKRQDKNEKLKYFTAEDFSLSYRPVDINYCGQKLNGGIYSKKPIDECDKLIIFSHGMGAGHQAYTTEIAYYANCGYAVLAYDNYGCGESGGKNMRGFYAGTEAIIAAYIAAQSDSCLKDKKVYLVGHSWGAYSVLCASERVKVAGVVAFAPFNSPVKIVHDIASQSINGFVGALVTPAVALMNFFRFGKKGNTKALKAIEKSNTPALIIWGEKDTAVTRPNSVAVLAKSGNVRKLIQKDKAHNPYNTVEAEAKLAELIANLNGKLQGDELTAYLSTFDWSAATAEDLPLMQKTADFIENN